MTLPTQWSSSDATCSVEVRSEVLTKIVELADKAHPLEIGTSLYGRYSPDERTAFIEGLAPVPRDSVGGRYHFRRGVVGLATFFRRLFSSSAGGLFYVGEFHSHPGGTAHSSSEDDATQFAIASDSECQCESPVLIILGGIPGKRQIAVYVHTRTRKKIVLHDSAATRADEPGKSKNTKPPAGS